VDAAGGTGGAWVALEFVFPASERERLGGALVAWVAARPSPSLAPFSFSIPLHIRSIVTISCPRPQEAAMR